MTGMSTLAVEQVRLEAIRRIRKRPTPEPMALEAIIQSAVSTMLQLAGAPTEQGARRGCPISAVKEGLEEIPLPLDPG